ncbi:hypothetical protein D3C76_1507490 [compost metagenome]
MGICIRGHPAEVVGGQCRLGQLHGFEPRIIRILRGFDRRANSPDRVDDRTTDDTPHGQAAGFIGGALLRRFHARSDGDVRAAQAHVLGADQVAGDDVEVPTSDEADIAFAGANGAAGQGGL